MIALHSPSLAYASSSQLASALLSKVTMEVPHASLAMLKSLDDIMTSICAIIRSAINADCPINRLPLELLTSIFEHVPEPYYIKDRYASLTTLVRTDELLPVTHVCHHWREAALNTPGLWSSLSNDEPHDLLYLYTSRSKQTALKMSLNNPRSDDVDLRNMLRSNGARLRTLYIEHKFDADLSPTTDFAAPNLEVLLLRSDASAYTTHVPRISTFHKGVVSRLRYLSMHKCPLRPTNAFPHLTHLNISHQSMGSVSTLLELLFGSPQLVQLTLIHLGTAASTTDVSSPIVDLKHLRNLALVYIAPQFVVALLSHMSIPADIAIQLEYLPLPDPTFFHDLPHLAAFDTATRMSVALSTHYVTVTTAGPSSAVCLSLDLGHGQLSWQNAAWVSSLFAILPLAKCKELWLIDKLTLHNDNFRLLLRQMVSLTVLVLYDTDYDGGEWLLGPPLNLDHVSPPENSSRPLVPSLITLHLLMDNPSIPEQLITLTADRAEGGRPLENLVLDFVLETPEEDRQEMQASENEQDVLNALQAHVGSVIVRFGDSTPHMALPAVCFDDMSYWGDAKVW